MTMPRERIAAIVQDLARQTRTPAGIAAKNHVDVTVVRQIRDHYGPEPEKLIEAAADLRRPAGDKRSRPAPAPTPLPTPEAPVKPAKRVVQGDGLTSAERAECRAWCAATGREVGQAGRIPQAILDAWNEAGRPVLDGDIAPVAPPAEPDDVVIDVEIVEATEAEALAIRRMRDAIEALETATHLVPWASENAGGDLDVLTQTLRAAAAQWRHGRDAQHLIGRARTALQRRGVEIPADLVREVLLELELV